MTQNQRKKAVQSFSSARSELLIVIILTVVNVAVATLGSNLEFLFTVTLPYAAALILNQLGMTLLGIAAAAVILPIYLWCWHLSRRSHVWLAVAAVAYALDTAFTVWFVVSFADPASGILPLGAHVIVTVLLFIGAVRGSKLAKYPDPADPGFGAPPQYGAPMWDQPQQYQPQSQYPPQPQYPPQAGSENGGPDGGAR